MILANTDPWRVPSRRLLPYQSQAARIGKWKGIRSVKNGKIIELYDLEADIGETANVAASHPNVVNRIAAYMDKAVTPHPRYEVGTVYKGWPIWKKSK